MPGTDTGTGVAVSDPSDAFEQEAEAAAGRFLRGSERRAGRGARTDGEKGESSAQQTASVPSIVSRLTIGRQCDPAAEPLVHGSFSTVQRDPVDEDELNDELKAPHNDPTVGQNKVVVSQCRPRKTSRGMGTVTFTLGPNGIQPSGFSVDPGVAGIQAGGDPLTYPQPGGKDSSASVPYGLVRPTSCPVELWVPPSSSNGGIGYCGQPPPTSPQVSVDAGMTVPAAPTAIPACSPISTWGACYEDDMRSPRRRPSAYYNIPSPDDQEQRA